METLDNPKETKARKRHGCDFCNGKIIIGEKYMKSTHVYDGRIYDWKTHKHCAKLADRLNMYDECDEGVTMDDFMEIVSEVHFDILLQQFPGDEVKKYSDVLQQLRNVNFNQKIKYVIRHFIKIDKEVGK